MFSVSLWQLKPGVFLPAALCVSDFILLLSSSSALSSSCHFGCTVLNLLRLVHVLCFSCLFYLFVLFPVLFAGVFLGWSICCPLPVVRRYCR